MEKHTKEEIKQAIINFLKNEDNTEAKEKIKHFVQKHQIKVTYDESNEEITIWAEGEEKWIIEDISKDKFGNIKDKIEKIKTFF